MSFWNNLPKPFFVLAPMADVTDAAFRRIIAKYGKPDVTWTEFVSADGLFLGGRDALMPDLAFTDAERPIVAQFFTSRPENMEKAAALAHELGFDGIDINMGCPDRSIEKQGAGAAHIKDQAHAQEVIAAAQQGAGDLPVSVKTRIGYNRNQLEEWIPKILEMNVAALTIHARTRKEMSLVPARWEEVRNTVRIRDEMKAPTLIIGNGDALSLEDAKIKAEFAGSDGVMLGRAIFGTPWLFAGSDARPSTLRKRFAIMIEHTKLYEELLPQKNFAIMKKHYKAYINGFDGAKELRMELMNAMDAAEVERIANTFLDRHSGVI